MRFSQALAALSALSTALAAPTVRRASNFNWGSDKMRGVNLGGWLVLEPWITPSIFQAYPQSRGIVDEYTLGQVLGHDEAFGVLQNHWNNWVKRSDLEKISNAGFNMVRIPVGFWAYTDAPPFVGGAAGYLDQAINWAREVGLKVMIDLHGAPGSQNAYDNSGQRMATPNWQSGNNVQTTLNVLQTIQNKYGDSSYDDVIVGIELLNEPLSTKLNFDQLKQFERDGYGQQRTSSQSRVVVISDAFKQASSYNGWLSPSDGAQNVAIDHHEYQVFTNELVSMQPWQHRQYVCNNAYTYSGADKWTFVGEWSAAMTDCAAALNGYGIGARYDGTYYTSTQAYGSCANINFMETWSQAMKDDTRAYIEAQMEVFERNTQGWVFWNFKTEASPEWDAFRLLDAGLFPQPLTDRKFGVICS